MEKIKYDNFVNDSNQSYVDSIVNDPLVIDYIEAKGWSNSVVKDNVVAFSDWLAKAKLCEGCHGLSECKQKLEGYTVDLDEEQYEILTECEYLLFKKQMLKHKSNYSICHLSDKSLMNDIDKIDLKNETNDYKNVVSFVHQWIDELPSKGIYFHGGLGVGKTYLCACICNALAKQGKKVAFVNVPKLASDLKNNMAKPYYVENQISKMRNAYVLVLDDIGAEKTTEWIRDDILFTVLDYRMENEKRTFFTSNSDIASLTKRFMAGPTEDETKALRIIERVRTLSMPFGIKGTSRRTF